ncbi:MAG TPA: hypothetical protein VK213_05970 [Bacteroidales bacterium]|nr:hypothetical protein [Bacteroidales bacterium]
MDRKKKIELLKKIAEGTASSIDLQNYVFIIEKDGKRYLSDGKKIIREIKAQELDRITVTKVFIDEEDLKA